VVKRLGFVFLSMAFGRACGLDDVTSKTFFTPRSFSDDAVKQNVFFESHLHGTRPFLKSYFNPDQSVVGFAASGFYQQSQNDLALAQYFLLGNKGDLVVREDGGGDINSDWINLSSPSNTFNARFSIRPKREVAGALLSFYHELFKISPGLWVRVCMPIVHVKHSVQLREFDNIGASATGTILNITQAFNQSAWAYGKINTAPMSRVGLDDFEARLGLNFFNKKHKVFGFYLLGHFPFGEAPSAQYIFEPAVGSNHWGVGGGLAGRLELGKLRDAHYFLVGNVKYKYRFRADELRSFDLRTNGSWSRYLQLARSSSPSTSLNGINHLTRAMSVRPGSLVDAMLGLNMRRSSLSFEAGYNVWWRQAERVKLAQEWDSAAESLGVFDLPNLGITGNSANDNARLGLASFTSDGLFKLLRKEDLYLDSAAAPLAFTHRVYAGVSLDYKFFKRSASIGLGGSYEHSQSNGALAQWDVWANSVISF
jgi:hypothetical protein